MRARANYPSNHYWAAQVKPGGGSFCASQLPALVVRRRSGNDPQPMISNPQQHRRVVGYISQIILTTAIIEWYPSGS